MIRIRYRFRILKDAILLKFSLTYLKIVPLAVITNLSAVLSLDFTFEATKRILLRCFCLVFQSDLVSIILLITNFCSVCELLRNQNKIY